MEQVIHMDIHIRQLRYFMELAKCLNFTKAALNLYIAQPALSQQISDLEKQLGVRLFDRDSRSVSLTSAGRVLLDACPAILNNLENVRKQMLLIQSGMRGSIRLGYLAEFRAMMPDLLHQFNQLYPDVGIELFLKPLNELKSALHDGMIDFFFSFIAPHEFQNFSFCQRILFADDLCLVIRKDHPFVLSGCKDYTLLKNETLFTLDQKISAYYPTVIENVCEEFGIETTKFSYSNDMITVILQVDAGLGYALLPGNLSPFAYDHITFIPIKKNYLDFGVVWKKENKNPVFPLFKEMLEVKFNLDPEDS